MGSWATADWVFGIPADKDFSFKPPENLRDKWEEMDDEEQAWTVMRENDNNLYEWQLRGERNRYDSIRILCLRTPGFSVSQGEIKRFKPDVMVVLPEQIKALVEFANSIGLVGVPDWYAFCDYS